MAVITFSRQYGSGGNEVARMVCEKLGYRYFDKTMMTGLCKANNLSCENLVDKDEFQHKVKGLIDELLGDILGHEEDNDWAREQARRIREAADEEDVELQLAQTVIRAAEEAGNVAIMGRGSQAVLQHVPGVLHVRVVAPLEARVQRVLERGEAAESDEARKLVDRLDEAAVSYVRRYYGVDPADPLLYHVVVNTGKMTLAAAAALIASAVTQAPSPAQPGRRRMIAACSGL